MLMSDEEQSLISGNFTGNLGVLHFYLKEEQFFYQCNMEKKELLMQDVASCLHEHVLF